MSSFFEQIEFARTFLTLGILEIACFNSLPALVGSPAISVSFVDEEYSSACPIVGVMDWMGPSHESSTRNC